MEARAALAETWGSLAEACDQLSATEWALPTECPGWDVKDQLSHLIGIERSLLGEAAPEWDGPPGPHVRNDVAAMNERWVAVRRPLPGSLVRTEFLEVTRARLAELERRSDDEWAAVGWSPVGEVPYAVFMEVRAFDSWVHEQDARRALDRPGGAGTGPRASRSTACRAPCRSSSASRPAVPRARRSASTSRDPDATPCLHDRSRGRTGPSRRGRRRPGGQPLAVEHRLHTPRLRPGLGGTGGGRRRGRDDRGRGGRSPCPRRNELHVLGRDAPVSRPAPALASGPERPGRRPVPGRVIGS